MKIKYKKKRLNSYQIMIVLWLILGVANFIFDDFEKWPSYMTLGISVMYLINYLYDYFTQYLTVDTDSIKENHLFGKKIRLSEIQNIKKFAGDYILKTDKTEMTINTQIIDETSLAELNLILEKLDLEKHQELSV